MRSEQYKTGQRHYRKIVADRLLDWAKGSEEVMALFWYGSYSVERWSLGSDLDAALLLRPGSAVDELRKEICTALGSEARMNLHRADPSRLICFIGNDHLKVECVLAVDPEQLAWLADSNDVPALRLVLAFERDSAGRDLASRAEQPCQVSATVVVNREIEKFLEAFEACSRAHHRSDAYNCATREQFITAWMIDLKNVT